MLDRIKTAVNSAAAIKPSDPDWSKFILEINRYSSVIYDITGYGDIDDWKEKIKVQKEFEEECAF